MKPSNPEILRIDDVCSQLGIGRNLAYKLLKSGDIKSAKIGKMIVIKQSDLNDYISNLAH